MNRKRNIASVGILLALYWIGIISSTQDPQTTLDASDYRTDAELSVLVHQIYFHTSAPETSIASLNNNCYSNTPENDLKTWALAFIKEWSLIIHFKQYYNFVQDIAVKFRKADLIFPFHNFW